MTHPLLWRSILYHYSMGILPTSFTITHPRTHVWGRRSTRIALALATGLLVCVPPGTVTKAQLSPCTPLQQEQGVTWCESPGENSKSLSETVKGWFGFTSQDTKTDRFPGLDPLPKPTIKNDLDELDPIVKPGQLPSNGVRDYLNRQDPEHAVYPIEPMPPSLSPTP